MEKVTRKESALFGPYVLIWLALLMLTGLTVTVAGMHLGNVSVITAVLVATVKGSLVLHHFMHLKYENRVFRLMLGVALVTLAVIMLFTFVDTVYR